MTPEQILAIEPVVLTQEQREFYFREGYLLLPGVIDPDWLERLRDATGRLVERSRAVTEVRRDLRPRARPSSGRAAPAPGVAAGRSTTRSTGSTSPDPSCPTSFRTWSARTSSSTTPSSTSSGSRAARR